MDFDIFVRSSEEGIRFASSDVFVDYSTEAFGLSVVSNNNIIAEKKQVIENPVYSLVLSDATTKQIKIEVTSAFQPNNLYGLALVPEKFCHMSLNIQDVYALATMSFDDIEMSDQSFFMIQRMVLMYLLIKLESPTLYCPLHFQ